MKADAQNQSRTRGLIPFKPGQSGNPGGKPTGARNALNAKFLKALSEDFDVGGLEAIQKCREEDPSAYIRALVALQPKELEVVRGFGDLTDEQLAAAIAAARSLASASSEDSGEGAGEQARIEPTAGVQPVSEAG